MSNQWERLKPFENLGKLGVPGLSFLDIRLLVRIIGDAAVVIGDLTAKRKFLLGAVAELVAAEAWAWSWEGQDVEIFGAGPPEIIVGGDETILPTTFFKASLDRVATFVKPNFAAKTKRMLRTFEYGDKPSEYAYVPSHHHFTIGMSCRSRELVSSIIFVRSTQRRIFTFRETKIVDIVGQEVVWLHDPSRGVSATMALPKLSPRKKLIAGLLVSGLGRNAIAAKLNISVNTAHTYIKSIYLAYGVNSQAALARIFADTNYGK